MKFEDALSAMREGKKVCNSNKPTDVYRMNDFGHLEIINDNFPDGCHSSISGDDIFAEDWEIVNEFQEIKNYQPSEVIRLKNEPIFETNIKEWERALKISEIHYNVGDDCVFVITRGNKKWTIPLDKFFDKVIEIAG